MADTRTFEAYFGSKAQLPGEQIIEDDELLVLRAGTVFRAATFADGAVASMAQNATATTLTTVDLWYSFDGTLADLDHTDSFTFATNQYTFIGDNRLHPSRLEVSMSLSKAGNGDRDIEVGLFVNAALVGTAMGVQTSGGFLTSVYCVAPYTLQTGDIIDARIRNLDGSGDDVTVEYAQLAIS